MSATPTGLTLSFSAECPHRLVQGSLEGFLRETRSLPLLLQGICYTGDTMSTLTTFVKRVPSVLISATTPAQIQLTYENSLYPQAKTLPCDEVSFVERLARALGLNSRGVSLVERLACVLRSEQCQVLCWP